MSTHSLQPGMLIGGKYELKQLLLAGLQQQLLLACSSSGLRKIALRRGRWYDGEGPSDRKVRFT